MRYHASVIFEVEGEITEEEVAERLEAPSRQPFKVIDCHVEEADDETQCQHEFEADLEYDPSGETVNCIHCGEPKHA